MKKFRAFRAWLVFDRYGTYQSVLYMNRKDAEQDKHDNASLRDAKLQIIRVVVKRVKPK